ncbi:MAG TPA: DNA-processing protein DprA, partial [Phaeodactylibacter sp.]|nr:DNA-processing protein DprA [Phaeodactylibacter sp.]
YGIDITAHRKCLDLSIPTIGVLGNGLDKVYPFVHKRVAEQMLQNGGLLSEFPIGTPPDREHFPMRNRIVAGMCDALVVVETKEKGGSMITANLANDYNKDVFAFPGRIHDPASKGCNMLIKSHRASLLEGAQDLIYIMRWNQAEKASAVQRSLFLALSNEEQQIADLLQSQKDMAIDQLTVALSKTPSEMAAILLNLEFQGVIRSLPGKRYALV